MEHIGTEKLGVGRYTFSIRHFFEKSTGKIKKVFRENR